MVLKIFDREILIWKLSTTILQIFCKIIFNSNIIVKSMRYPDNEFLEELLEAIMGSDFS